MTRGRTALFALLAGSVALLSQSSAPAEASHSVETLEVTVALNAAGGDEISVKAVLPEPSTGYQKLASDVAISMGRPRGSFRTSEDFGGGYIHPDTKLIQPDGDGRLSYSLHTAELQLLALQEGYDAVIVVVCTPLVRQVFETLVAPQRAPFASPGSRCSGWYQEVEEAPLSAVVRLQPDPDRYSSAMVRIVGAAAIALGLLGLLATFLRRGPLDRRSVTSWLLSIGAGLAVGGLGWSLVSVALWLSGPAADPMLLGGGPDSEQVARTLLPGLVFLVPALLPAAILLSAAPRQRRPPVNAAPVGPPLAIWWPTQWWGQWAAQGGSPPPPPPPPGAGHG